MASQQAANLANALHAVEKDGHEPSVILLDVAKVFPSPLDGAIFELVQHAGYPANYVAAMKKVYQHNDTYYDVKGQHIHYKPTRGVKEGCPCSPLLLSMTYELPLKQLIAKYPHALVYADNVFIIVKSQEELECLFAHLSVWGSRIGIRFNPNRTETSHFHRPNSPKSGVPKYVWWGSGCLPVSDPIFTYLGHTNTGTGYKGKAQDALFAFLQAQMTAYYELPLTCFERAQIVNSILLPRWTYKSLFLWCVSRGNRLEATFEDYVLAAPRVERYLHHRMYTDTTHGGLGLYRTSWAGMCALVQLVQRALRLGDHKMPT